MRAHAIFRLAATGVATLLATMTGLWAFCDSALETYAIFQCSDRAYFAPVPAPFAPSSVTGVFWQVGFGSTGSPTRDTGAGTDGTGVQSKSQFNGNDNGLFVVDIRDAAQEFPTFPFPPGSVCLGSNNWANFGVDGCCDNPRPGSQFLYTNVYSGFGEYTYQADDNILNPYYGFYLQSTGFYGYYSLGSLMDYPTAVLLRTPVDPNLGTVHFAIAAVTNMDRANTGGDGPCKTVSPGTNLGACDIRQGFFALTDVTNGGINVMTGQANVIPWQQPPSPLVDIVAGDPNDPNAILTLDVTWTPVTIHSDQRSVPSNNPTMAPADPNAAEGPGVVDINTRFGLARYRIEVAAENDPAFSSITQSVLCLKDPSRSDPACTGPTAATIDVAVTECLRITTLFGPHPRETVNTVAGVCRMGKCGDVGYEVVSARFCPGSAGCIPTLEVCDGFDNNCNTQVDEGFNIGQACNGVGECGAGARECSPVDPNQSICSTDPGGTQDQAVSEICDSLDNDCDAATDETFPTLGNACNGQLGVCVDPNGPSGEVECSASDPNTTQCSRDPGGSQSPAGAELCDVLDNDCDGQTDEGLNIGQPCTGTGECAGDPNAVLECHPTSLAVICSVDPGGSNDQSSPESCDGLDNDCDAGTDENFGVGQTCNGSGECSLDPNGNSGVIECTSSTTSGCSLSPGGSNDQSSAELCDGLDNDCDTFLDEDFMLGQSCNGVGECGAGARECSPADANTTICSTDPGGSQSEAVPEICSNNQDDDCDGMTDEPGGVELCDDVDNNCDGLTDEGFNLGQACTGIGQCGAGMLECSPINPSATICSTSPGGSDDQSSGELCDAIDNDCDASTDEGFNLGQSCNGVGECGAGVRECGPNPLGSICSTEPGGSADQSIAEVCDGLDNDCDGGSDDGFNIGADCSGLGACADDQNGDPGVIECDGPSASRCSIAPGGSNDQSTPEICEPDIDNDCDGMTDEDGVCAAQFEIQSHTNGDPVSCSAPKSVQPRFQWFKGPYDRFKAELSWDPNFVKGKRMKPYDKLTDPIWEPNGKQWKKACKRALLENPGMPVIYVRAFGTELDLPKGDPNREVESPVVTVVPTP